MNEKKSRLISCLLDAFVKWSLFSFVFRETKNCFNVSYCRFSWTPIIISCHKFKGILSKKWLAFAVCIIFFPCLVEGSTLLFCEEKTEFIDCHLMLNKCTFKNMLHTKFELVGMPELRQFREKGVSKPLSGKVFAVIFCEQNRNPECQKNTEQGSNNGAPDTYQCKFIGTKIQFWVIVLSGWVTGGIIGLLLARLIIRWAYSI